MLARPSHPLIAVEFGSEATHTGPAPTHPARQEDAAIPHDVDALASGLAGHGAGRLSAVHIDGCNAELQDETGFVGDRASGRAFRAMLEDGRESIRNAADHDPIGPVASTEISKKKLDRLILRGDPVAAGVVLGTIETFAQEFAGVARRIMRLPEWQDTQRIVVGGGLRASRIGELAIGRAAGLVRATHHEVELLPIRHIPDEAGLIGCIHLAPPWIFSSYDSILAVDIGGSNIRVGVVVLNQEKAADLSRARVSFVDLWRHRDDEPSRAEAVERLIAMLTVAAKRARKRGLYLAPFVGVGCPGLIRDDGSIEKGGQNLPGDWEHADFNLPRLLQRGLPRIAGHEITVLMHNDAVVQGLSEAPFMRDVERWGVMTIGTGLGNARFTNRVAGRG